MPVSGTTITSSADVINAQIEKVRNKTQELFETSDTVAAMVKKGGEVETISEKLYRIPLLQWRGGVYGKFDANGGDMGTGSGPKVLNVTAGFIYSRLTFELALQAIDTSARAGQSVLNTFSYTYKNAMRELQVQDDILFHTDGTGKLTNASSGTGTWSGGSKRTYTFAGATDKVGVDRLRPGMAVDAYDSAGANKRASAGAQPMIDHIDWDNKVVYLTEDITSAASGDLLAFTGLTATLQSFQSGWPLTGDSFRHGLRYVLDATTSNYYLGQLKSTVTELLANNVNAASSGLAFAHGQQLLDKIIKRRDESAFKGLYGLAPLAQRAAVQNIGIAITQWPRSGGEKTLDLMPSNNSYSDTFDFCGITCRVDKRQDKDRFDFIIPKLWGRAQLFDAKMHEVGGTNVFESRTSSGTLKAAIHFHIVQAYDYYSTDPGAQGYISSLSVPSNY